MATIYEQVRQALQDVVAPEIKELRAGIRRLDEKIDSRHNEVLSEIKRLDEKIELGFQFRDRLTALEAKVTVLTESLSR